MTTLALLIILAVGVVWLIHKKPLPMEEAQQSEPLSTPQTVAAQQPISLHDNQESTEELIAVIIAAIAELTGVGSEEFRVLNIRQYSGNWALTGRQDVIHHGLTKAV